MALANSTPGRRSLEDRLLSVFVAISAKMMRLFGALCLVFHAVDKNSRSNFLKLIALLLSFPCFKASNLFFKLAYLLNQRKALLQSRRCAALGVYDLRLEFDKLSLEGGTIAQTYGRLNDILSRLERAK